ncbi:hypothetical protein JRC04_02110 [Mycolicibacterium sp. S2-37]|uniref:hypothetical protein n=1 Tax=Mycolicibacterium sp. S2-37 TaxID=2810297 RepID=UPI001A94C969|nr:hypothetical protein [Mycolicibacterium sp. S2-37]MBO0676253.1 hypothetical protein [Mycolicibacterium sp. S2-37]
MSKHPRTLLLGLSAIFTLGTVSACAGGSSTDTTTSSAAPSATTTSASAAAFPQSAKYIADMEKDGRTMTIGIAVDGDSIAAYACNGSDDEAWFFGDEKNGSIDLTSRFRDTLTASFDGTDVDGNLTMDGVTYTFTAAEVPAPAGMYTAELGGVRESWVLRPNGSAVGVQFGGMGGGSDFGEFERQQLADAQFRADVRNKRLLRQAGDLQERPDGKWGATINGQPVEAVVVDGNFRLG